MSDSIFHDQLKNFAENSGTEKILDSFKTYLNTINNACEQIYLKSLVGINEDKIESLCHYSTARTFPLLVDRVNSCENNRECENKITDNTHKCKVSCGTFKGGYNKIRLYNAQYLNDPNEGTSFFFKLLNNNTSFANDIKSEYSNQIRTKSDIYILSFTTLDDFLPMWSMYGDGGKGVCLKTLPHNFQNHIYEDKGEDIIVANSQFRLSKVFYIGKNIDSLDTQIKEEVKSISDALSKISNELEFREPSVRELIKKEVLISLDKIRFLFKDESYKFENEYRVIHNTPDYLIDKIKVDSDIRLYIELPFDLSYTEMILGPKCENSIQLTQLALHNPQKVSEVKKSNVKYR